MSVLEVRILPVLSILYLRRILKRDLIVKDLRELLLVTRVTEKIVTYAKNIEKVTIVVLAALLKK